MEMDSDMKNRFPDFICNVVKQLCELRTIVNEDIQSSTLDTNAYANKLRDYISRLKLFINKVDTDFTKNYEKYSKDLEISNIVKSKNKTTKQNEDTDKPRQHSPKPVENGSSTDKEDETTDDHSKSNNNDLENHIAESESLTKTTTKSKKDIKEKNVKNGEESTKETVEKSNNETSTTENSQNEKESSNSDVSNVENSIESSTTEDDNNSEKVKIKEEVKNPETNQDKENEEEKPKIGLIKLIDISKLLDPKIKQQTKQVDDSVILLTSSESEDDKPLTILKTNKKQETLKTYSRKNIESRFSEKTEDQCNKIEEETNERKNLRTRTKREPVKKSIFEKYRKIRSTRLGKKILDSSSSGSETDSDSSNQSEVSHVTNTSKRKTVKFALDPNYDYKNDPKFSMKCCVKVDRIAADEMLNRHLTQMEEKQIERLTNMKALKRSRKSSKSDSNSSSSSDSDVKHTKKRTKVDKDDGKKGDLPSDSDTEDKIETPMDVANEIIEKQIDLADQAAEALEKSSDDEVPKHNEASSDDDDDEKKKKKKLKDKEEKPEKQSSDDDEKQSKEEEKENKEKENSVKSDAEDEQDENKEKKDDEEKHSSDSDFQKKDKKKWRNDKLLKEKLDATDSEEELIIFRNKKNKLENEVRSGTEEEIKLPKKRSNRKAIKRVKQRAKFDSSSSSDESNKKEENYKEEKKSSSSSSSSSSSDSEEEKMGKKKKTVRKRIKNLKDSEESSANEAKKEDDEDGSTRKKIRNVWTRDSLAETTRKAAKEEEERKKRIAERQKLYNEIYDTNLAENAKVEKLVLDFNEETKEELLSVHPDLVSKLKPHQANGIRFMWNACFESLERSKATGGSGCILAHCMGLGKTLQVITLIHTLLTNTDKTNIRTAMVVCPLSTVLNWISEFKKWLDDLDGPQVNVFDLVSYRQNHERLYQMQDWMKMGGVMILGYDMFRNLSNPKGKRMSKKLMNGFAKCLLEPGPDLVICDEGHLLKNEKTGISIAMNKLQTKRRIVLTGTPLQNNLKEYFCMVQFVKPNLLGTYKEYLNRFVNPITNGQYTDSTPHDISIMRKRAHVLHKMLDAVVERRDYNVLAPFLPPKHEYVLFVTLTPVQCELYKEYLSRFARNQSVKGTSYIFQDFQELQRICIHPRVLLDKSNQDKLRKEVEDDEEELQNFINDDESEKSSSGSSSSGSDSDQSDKVISTSKRRTRANPGNLSEEEEVLETNPSRDEWWSKFCMGDELDNICHGSKIILLFDILAQCEAIGDKVLLFSQSLYSLNLIEYFLERIDEATSSGQPTDKLGNHTGSWVLGLDYFRMDGSSSCDNRAAWCKSFNDENNTRARLFLISTRAGGLGINLVAANRVIIFDVSWNPSYDVQSIYRVYRFGQTKPCYVYRFVTLGTMENKIYERQVTKQAISKRVIDEQQIDRHYNQNDLSELYVFKPVPEEERPTPLVPKDRLFANLLQSHEKQIFKYHEHNSLLEDKADEGLNEEERRAAWEEFENEKKQPTFNLMQTMVKNGMYETLRIIVQQDNSTWTPAQINNILPSIVQRMSEQVAKGDFSMYRRIEEKHEARVLEQRKMQYLYQQYIQQMRAPANANYMAFDPTKFNQYLKTVTSAPNILGQFASSSGGMFTQGAAPPPMPTVVSDVVELND